MTDDLLDTVAVHVNWLRRDDPLTNRADSMQSADYLERLAVALRAADADLATARTALTDIDELNVKYHSNTFGDHEYRRVAANKAHAWLASVVSPPTSPEEP